MAEKEKVTVLTCQILKVSDAPNEHGYYQHTVRVDQYPNLVKYIFDTVVREVGQHYYLDLYRYQKDLKFKLLSKVK